MLLYVGVFVFADGNSNASDEELSGNYTSISDEEIAEVKAIEKYTLKTVEDFKTAIDAFYEQNIIFNIKEQEKRALRLFLQEDVQKVR